MITDHVTRGPTAPDPRRILVAEDNGINQKLILRQLALLGFDADLAVDGYEALACWQRGHYALLLCDLRMPRMDGCELAVAIRIAEQAGLRAGAPRTTIIALTASTWGEQADKCREAGMDGYLAKPLQLGDLNALLQVWLPDWTGNAPATGTAAPASNASFAINARNRAPVDVRVLEALIGSDPAINRSLQRQFQLSAAEIGARLGRACAGGDSLLASEQAHKLGSAARAVGALPLGALCAQMEVAGNNGDPDALARLWVMFEKELAAVNRFLDAVEPAQDEAHNADSSTAGSSGIAG